MRARIAVAAWLVVSGCWLKGQTVSYGVVGGVLLTSPDGSSYPFLHREDKRYTVGPLIEFGLTKHIAVEFSPLYKRFGYSETFPLPNPCNAITGCNSAPPVYYALRERVNAWEFPIVGKYYFGKQRRPWRPFVLTGYSFTKTWISQRESGTGVAPPINTGISSSPVNLQMIVVTIPNFNLTTPLGVGAVFGGGIVAHKGPAWIGPEFRYTRNGVSGQNQAEVLVSVRF